jgi:hypothetical protein
VPPRSDQCPECAFGSIDLQTNGDGRWKIEWEPVQCPVGSSTFKFGYQGGNPYYKKLQVANARVPIAKVEMARGGGWQQLVATIDNYFEAHGGCGAGQRRVLLWGRRGGCFEGVSARAACGTRNTSSTTAAACKGSPVLSIRPPAPPKGPESEFYTDGGCAKLRITSILGDSVEDRVCCKSGSCNGKAQLPCRSDMPGDCNGGMGRKALMK